MFKLTLAGLAALAALLTAAPAQASPIQEDDPRWDCRVNGDSICGPGNSNGVAPGLYTAGRLTSPWPTATVCATPPTLVTLMLGPDCRTEFVAPALVVATGALR